MRPDSRKNSETRRIQLEQNLMSRSDGSAKFEFGDTGVICAINGPMEPQKRDELHDQSYIQCTFISDTISSLIC